MFFFQFSIVYTTTLLHFVVLAQFVQKYDAFIYKYWLVYCIQASGGQLKFFNEIHFRIFSFQISYTQSQEPFFYLPKSNNQKFANKSS